MSGAGVSGDWSPATGPVAACEVCGRSTSLYVDGVPRHLYCFLRGQPHPSMRALDVPSAPDAAGSEEAAAAVTAADGTSGAEGVGGPAPDRAGCERLPLDGPAPAAAEGWRAPAAVFDPSGVYLPDGTRWPLPDDVGVADVLAAGDRLGIGHPAGVGALVLTDELCVRLGLDLVVPAGVAGDDARQWMRAALVEAGEAFLAGAVDAGWRAHEDRLGPETRIRRAAGPDGVGERAFDLVLLDYLWTFDRRDSHLAQTVDPDWPVERQYAEIARLYGRAGQLLGIPWQGTARQVGQRLFDVTQKQRTRAAGRGKKVDDAGRDRGRVVEAPGPRPQLAGWVPAELEPETNWRRPGGVPTDWLGPERLWVHTFDRRAAYLASMGGAELGYLTEAQPRMRHLVGAGALCEAVDAPQGGAGKPPAGLYRLTLPAWRDETLPPPHPLMRADEAMVVWTTAPSVELLCGPDDTSSAWPGAGYTLAELLDEDSAEAWVFPAQGRLLAGWYATLRDARVAADADRDQRLVDTIKLVYAGYQGGLARREALGGKRPYHHQPLWRDTIRASSRAAVWRRLWTGWHLHGMAPLAVEVDEVAYLSTSQDPARAAPMVDEGKLGQLRAHKSLQLTDAHRAALAEGRSALSLLGERGPGAGEGVTGDAAS